MLAGPGPASSGGTVLKNQTLPKSPTLEHKLRFSKTCYSLSLSLLTSTEPGKSFRYVIGNPDKEVGVRAFLCCEWVEHLSFWATFKVCECQHICIILGNISPGETFLGWMLHCRK